MGILNNFEKYTNNDCRASGQDGRDGIDGIGFKLTGDGNYDIDGKRLTNLAESVDDNDAVTLKVLKEHTQVSQNNYHLQPSFKIYKNFGDKSQLTVGKPPNTPSNHFFNNHKAHHDPYIVDKEADDTGFSGEAWSSMIMKGNQLDSGTYTSILEIFVIGPSGRFRVDDTIIYQVWGDSHYTIITFDSDKISGQYTRSIIQFTTDGGAGVDDGIKFQIKYFGSQYNKNIKFLFYSRVVKGKQSTSFDHTIFNVSDVQDNHTILYFENLNINGNFIYGLSDPVKLDNAANKNYVDIENARQDIAISDKASKSYVDGEIAKIPHVAAATDVLKLDGSKAMTGALNMNNNEIKNLKDPVNDQDAGTKKYVDGEIAKIPHVAPVTDVLKLDGSKAMSGNLNMNDHVITGLKSTSNLTGAVNYKQLTDKIAIFDNNLKLLIDNKIAESESFSIESINQENVFKRVMDNDEFKEEDADIHKIGVQNKDYHLVNKKTYEFKIDYDSNIHYYSTRLAIDLQYLPTGSYTMVYEMYIDNGITVNEIDAIGDNVSVGRINSRIDGTETRTIIHFTKNTIQSGGDDDLNIDIKLKGKTDPQTTIYVVVYGVKGYFNNVSVRVWDRFYYFDNNDSSIKYEAPIDMNNKDITNVNKISTTDLDVKGQIDMKSKKIINLPYGQSNGDAVNKEQYDALNKKLMDEIIALQNLIDRINNWNYFTDQLKHNKSSTVKFPAISNNYPYSATNGSELLRISFDGRYHIIYTDFYTKSGQFIIHDDVNGNDLFVVNVQKSGVRGSNNPIIINTIIPINVDNGFNHVDIKLYIKSNYGAYLDGVRASTFFIKYLGP